MYGNVKHEAKKLRMRQFEVRCNEDADGKVAMEPI
jgi:hypothetical protein